MTVAGERIEMRYRELAVGGAFEFTPEAYPDERGYVVSPYQEAAFVAAVGHRMFPVVQLTHSTSRRGVVRGLHFTMAPPGNAKYVHCANGELLDIVVDLRVGSPTFGQWDSVVLDGRSGRALYAPVGTGHAFVALADDTAVSYLFSQKYVAAWELAVSPFDPALALPIPDHIEITMSERDRTAPTLREMRDSGMLPDYDTCMRIEESFHPSARRAADEHRH